MRAINKQNKIKTIRQSERSSPECVSVRPRGQNPVSNTIQQVNVKLQESPDKAVTTGCVCVFVHVCVCVCVSPIWEPDESSESLV